MLIELMKATSYIYICVYLEYNIDDGALNNHPTKNATTILVIIMMMAIKLRKEKHLIFDLTNHN